MERDATKGRILSHTVNGKPVDGTLQVKSPFHLAVDQQDRIWVTGSPNTVTRFPASDPGKAEQIKVGYGPHGIAIDSLGNAWVANSLGHPGTREKLKLVEGAHGSKVEGHFESAAAKADAAPQAWIDLYNLVTAIIELGACLALLCPISGGGTFARFTARYARRGRARTYGVVTEVRSVLRDLVVRFINPLTYSAVLFRADGVARTLQICGDMLGARALSARKTPCRLRQRIYETDHLGIALPRSRIPAQYLPQNLWKGG